MLIGLEPAVSFVARRWLPRWAVVALVFLALLGAVGGFLAAAVSPLTSQARAFVNQAPHYLQTLQDHNSLLGQLNDRVHVQQRLTSILNGHRSALTDGVLGAGVVVFGAVTSVVVVIVLTVNLLADLPRIRRGLYRLVPQFPAPASDPDR